MKLTRLMRGVALLMAIGCSHHVRLAMPKTSIGAQYSCTKGGCVPATVVDPAARNPMNTVFIVLPKECNGRLNEAFIENANSDDPKVTVLCATPDTPIEQMR